jgi:hypothetical protein
LTSETISPPGRRTSAIGGKMSLREMKLTSVTARAGRSGKSSMVRYRALKFSHTHTRGNQVLVTRDADDVVKVLMEYGQAGIACPLHAFERRADRLGVFDPDDVDTRTHDVADGQLVERKDFADHALLVFKQLFGFVDEFFDLLFGNGFSALAERFAQTLE